MEQKKRVIGLDILRSVATLFVISVHYFLNTAFYSMPVAGKSMFIMIGMRWLFYICVPLFLLLTGYLNCNKKLEKGFYKGCFPIIETYLIISLLTILGRIFVLGETKTILEYIMGIFNFTTIGYAWYIEMYLGLYLLIPFFNILYKNLESKKNKLILITVLLAICSLPPLTNGFVVGSIRLDIFPDYWVAIYPILYYFIGCFIREYQPKVAPKYLLIGIVGTLFLETLISYFYYMSIGNFNTSIFESYNALPTIIISTLLFLLLYQIKFKSPWKNKIITNISIASLDMYLFSFIVDQVIYSYFFDRNLRDPLSLLKSFFIIVPSVFITSYLLAIGKNGLMLVMKKIKNKIGQKLKTSQLLKKMFHKNKIKNDKKLIVKWQAKNYFFSFLKSSKIKELYSTDDFQELCQFLDKVGKDNIPLGTWIDLVKNTDMIIFFDSALNDTAIKKAKEINPNIQIYVYFWNPINDQNKELLTNPYIDKFYTYDKKDAKKYKINYNAQFYTTKIKLRKRKKVYDICFLGRDKNRKKWIKEVEKQFKKRNLSTNIKIINEEKDFIPYSEYLKTVEKSNCILDIVANNQQGLSLRVMESIFLKKKLITNNKNVKDFKFYNKNNIFIIGIDKWENLEEFLNKKYHDIDRKILEKYDFKNWLDRFK